MKQRVIGYRPNLSGLTTQAARATPWTPRRLRPPEAASTGGCSNFAPTVVFHGYTIVELIGRGSFGSVWKGKKDGLEYALKCGSDASDVAKETQILLALKSEQCTCKHVVLHEEIINNVIVMTLCYASLQGDQEQQEWNVDNAHVILSGTAQGLEELHRLHVCHRDIKLANIVRCNWDVVKIIDLGIAKKLSPGQTKVDEFEGTDEYLAPELFWKGEYNLNVDVWALAIVLGQCVQDPPDIIPRLMQERQSLFTIGFIVQDPNLRVPKPDCPYKELFTHMLCDAADRWSSTQVCEYMLTIGGERRKVREYN